MKRERLRELTARPLTAYWGPAVQPQVRGRPTAPITSEMPSPSSHHRSRTQPTRPSRNTIMRRRVLALTVALFVLALILGAMSSPGGRHRQPASTRARETVAASSSASSATALTARPKRRHRVARPAGQTSNVPVPSAAVTGAPSAPGSAPAAAPSATGATTSGVASAPTPSCALCATSGSQPAGQVSPTSAQGAPSSTAAPVRSSGGVAPTGSPASTLLSPAGPDSGGAALPSGR